MQSMKVEKIDLKYYHIYLTLDQSKYAWFKQNDEESGNVSPMPPLDGDKGKVRERKGIKISALNELLSRLPVLSAQIEAGNNSYTLKNKIRQIVCLLY